jgi:hypothetical protein
MLHAHDQRNRGEWNVAKQKGETSASESYENTARAERRLLRDEERALKRLEKAQVRLVRAEERLSRARDRFEQRQAAVSVAEDEFTAAQRSRAEGPSAQEKITVDDAEAETVTSESESADSDRPEISVDEAHEATSPMPPPQSEPEG